MQRPPCPASTAHKHMLPPSPAYTRQMLAGDAYSTFCLVSLRRSIGASQLRALCRHAGVLDRAVVRQALGKSPRPAAAQAAQA
eukprot:scaffold11828_cov112-Isochrysis_galbana.AAC.2